MDGSVSTCGDGGGHPAAVVPIDLLTSAKAAHRLWTGESSEVFFAPAPRVTGHVGGVGGFYTITHGYRLDTWRP